MNCDLKNENEDVQIKSLQGISFGTDKKVSVSE